jgi:hypothetical protein
MIRTITMMSKAPKVTPTPMPTFSSVDNEDGGLEGEELDEEDAAVEGMFEPTS